MLALVLDETLNLVHDYPRPGAATGEALIRVGLAGVCATDQEMLRGYKGFQGVIGHEFVGTVVECDQNDWVGKRVVGEINVGCGRCRFCHQGIPSQCSQRKAIGIQGRDGAFAEYLTLPVENLHAIPEDMPDRVAVFAEPVAAALQVLSLAHVRPDDRTAVVGDGKLGLLVAQVLAATGAEVTVIGRHTNKLALAESWGLGTDQPDSPLDVVVDCTGNQDGFAAALDLVRPRGTLVLKSTYPGMATVDLTRVVVDEIRLVGSRCGPFAPALKLLQTEQVDVVSMIDACYPLSDGVSALEHAGRRGALKVLIDPRS